MGLFTAILPILCYLLVVDRPSDKGLPNIYDVESAEGRDPSPEMLESMTMLKGVRMAFSSGQKFWPLALWSFNMYGTVMMYQCLQIGPYYDSVYGWRTAA